MLLINQYLLRLERKKRRVRALRKRKELTLIQNHTHKIAPNDILCFATIRNEYPRLPYFLSYYRKLGVKHFFFVDNGSQDETRAYLTAQDDVSLWYTEASYKRSRFGMDWLNSLLSRFGHGHWCLTLDVDEFFIYPFCDTRPLRALTDWLDASSIRSFGTILLDMYPQNTVEEAQCAPGQNPLEVARYFDSGNYTVKKNQRYGNLWIQGGPRQRAFFADRPEEAPALNKIPLVKWSRGAVYVSSTHALLPRGLNRVYDEWGGQKACGCLLHTKFLMQFSEKVIEELHRKEHYAVSREYKSYAKQFKNGMRLRTKFSERYENWQQLQSLGLLSAGNWA